MPANGRLLRIGYRSPGSEIGRCGSESADSLRRIFEIFPFRETATGDRVRSGLRGGRGSAISGILRYGRWSGRTGDN
jgi:hypothetical protein